jgi:Mrp family chromosome partitioning ATPase
MNNPPAFPRPFSTADSIDPDVYYPANVGMTLRDYFAAKAMQALLSDTEWLTDKVIKDAAKAAYIMADAMLKEREE